MFVDFCVCGALLFFSSEPVSWFSITVLNAELDFNHV